MGKVTIYLKNMKGERFNFQGDPKEKKGDLSVEEIYKKVYAHVLEEAQKGAIGLDETIEDPQIEELLGRLDFAGELGKVTKEYFKEQIPKSTHKSLGEYKDSYRSSWMEEQSAHLRRSYDLAREFGLGSALEIIRSGIDSGEISPATFEEICRKEVDDNTTKEEFVREIQLGDEQLKVYEMIENYLIRRGDKLKNVAQSNIVVKDNKTGRMLALADILPARYRLVPSGLQVVEQKREKTTGKIKNLQVSRTIEDYINQGDENNEFVAVAYGLDKDYQGGNIQYGDLSKSGGFLSLLHEIAHAWQHAHGVAGERTRFEEYISEMNENLERLAFADESFHEGDIGAQTYKKYTDIIKSELEAMGVEIVSDQNIDDTKMSFVTSSRYFFQINSETFIKLFDKFANEEREAWAHAIKVLRFLRRSNINLEPELKSRSDIMAKVNTSLATYDKILKEKIIPIISSKARKFSSGGGEKWKTHDKTDSL